VTGVSWEVGFSVTTTDLCTPLKAPRKEVVGGMVGGCLGRGVARGGGGGGMARGGAETPHKKNVRACATQKQTKGGGGLWLRWGGLG